MAGEFNNNLEIIEMSVERHKEDFINFVLGGGIDDRKHEKDSI